MFEKQISIRFFQSRWTAAYDTKFRKRKRNWIDLKWDHVRIRNHEDSISNFLFCVWMPQLYPCADIWSDGSPHDPPGLVGGWERHCGKTRLCSWKYASAHGRTRGVASQRSAFYPLSHHNKPRLLGEQLLLGQQVAPQTAQKLGKCRSRRLQAGRCWAGGWGWGIRLGMCGHRSSFREFSPALRFNLLSRFATSVAQEVGRNPNGRGGFYAFWAERTWFVAGEI